MAYIFGLFEKYAELKVMRFLLTSRQAVHLKELARKTNTSPATVSKLLNGLQKDGLIEKQIVGNAHVIKVKNENPLVRQLRVLINLSLLFEHKIIEKILELDECIYSIAMYGSFVNGTNDEKSDLDLLVISDSKKGFNSVADYFEEKTGIETNIEAFSVLDWKKCKEKNRAFYDSVKANHALLFGGELF